MVRHERSKKNIFDTIIQRGAEIGFVFSAQGRGRIYNTFNAHRLLYWAGLEGRAVQLMLKKYLQTAYFGLNQNIESHDVLVSIAMQAGLDVRRAREILATDVFAENVRTQEAIFQRNGIQSVPSLVINDAHLIVGAHPVASYETALRSLVAAMGQ